MRAAAPVLLLAIAVAVNGRSTHHYHSLSGVDRSGSDVEERRDDYSPLRYHPLRYVTDDGDSDDDDRDVVSGARGGPPVKSGVTPQQIKDLVDAHNAFRAAEGASNMEIMKWNPEVAKTAQQWADRCEFEHGQPPFNEQQVGYKQMGQNLYANTDPGKTVKDGVKAWFDEKSDYTFDTMACRPGKMCGHYTQVVWGTTREVGCGLTNCTSISGMRFANYLVCNYGPPGNWAGQKPYKKGDACTACDSGKFFCTNNLCDFSCNAPGSSSCQCKANCGKCGTKTNDCKCQCKPGFSGVACNEQCKDNHQNCGGNPGWPASWCDPGHQFVLDNCPKLCKKCEAPSGGATCSLKTYGRKGDNEEHGHKDSDESDNRGNFQAELLEFVEKIQGQLHKRLLERNSDASEDDRKRNKDSDDSEDDKRKHNKDSDDSEDDKIRHTKDSDDSEDDKRRHTKDSDDSEDDKRRHTKDSNDSEDNKRKHTKDSDDSEDDKRRHTKDSDDSEDDKRRHTKDSDDSEDDKRKHNKDSDDSEDDKRRHNKDSDDSEDDKRRHTKDSDDSEDDKRRHTKDSDDSEDDKRRHTKDSDDSEDDKRKHTKDSDDSEDDKRKHNKDSDDSEDEDRERRRYFIEKYEREDDSSYERNNDDSSEDHEDDSSYERNHDDDSDDDRLAMLLARVEKLQGKQ